MSSVDTRQVNRDSLFLLAQLRIEGQEEVHRVKVRNLSSGGMMAEGAVRVQRGQLVSVELRNIGWVSGSVAWVQDERFGIAFIDEIDPARVRAPVTASAESPVSKLHKPLFSAKYQIDPSRLRKI
ncbi:MAG: PilZ domain-containing protein [Alteraurantiacibacter sp.]|nr:PilZ domain-containing protein [Alteraurantiacibacter sp.]